MKSFDQATKTILASPTLWMEDCYEIELQSGGFLRWTSADVDIEIGGRFYSGHGARLSRSKIRMRAGLEVDELDLTIHPNLTQKPGTSKLAVVETDPGQQPPLSVPLIQAVHNGLLDRAPITIRRAIHAKPPEMDPLNPSVYDFSVLGKQNQLVRGKPPYQYPVFRPSKFIEWFVGFVAEVRIGMNRIDCSCVSALDLLNTTIPRYTYKAGCVWDLYKKGCGLNLDDFSAYGVVTQAHSRQAISVHFTTFGPKVNTQKLLASDGYLDLGVIRFLSGPNAYAMRTVRASKKNYLELATPVPYDFNLADGAESRFMVAPGCNKTLSECRSKFNNLDNFRGFPFIPGTTTLKGVVGQKDMTNDGVHTKQHPKDADGDGFIDIE